MKLRIVGEQRARGDLLNSAEVLKCGEARNEHTGDQQDRTQQVANDNDFCVAELSVGISSEDARDCGMRIGNDRREAWRVRLTLPVRDRSGGLLRRNWNRGFECRPDRCHPSERLREEPTLHVQRR